MESELKYASQSTLNSKLVWYEIIGDTLVISEEGKKDRVVRFDAIGEVRLEFVAQQRQHPEFLRCTLTLVDRERIHIDDMHYDGEDLDKRTDWFKLFLKALHTRLKKFPIEYRHGASAVNTIKIGVILFVLSMTFLLIGLKLYYNVTVIAVSLFVAGGILLIAIIGKLRNLSRKYDPDDLPGLFG